MKFTIEIPDEKAIELFPYLAALNAVIVDEPKSESGELLPPPGFAFWGDDPLPFLPEAKSKDIMWHTGTQWSHGAEGEGWFGVSSGPWAVRVGSEVALKNGITQAEP